MVGLDKGDFQPQEKRWRRRKEARPGEIIAAALRIFAKRGYSAARLADIAEEAGITKPAVYLYFDSKQDLFKAVMRQAVVPSLQLDRLTRMSRERRTGYGDLIIDVHLLWAQTFMRTNTGALIRIAMTEASNFPDLAAFCYREAALPCHRLFREIIRRGIEAGEFGGVDIDHAARAITAPILTLSLLNHDPSQAGKDDTNARGAAVTGIALLVAGLRSYAHSN